MITQTPSFKTLQTKIGGKDWCNCAKTVEAGLKKITEITDIHVVFTTENFV
ncbi:MULTISPECIES: hypothetical protein [unclassified Microcoleus]|uniref:hypothetical protein n=1 Tax=unclassified Microcoleus TaxID=2642155 RepID=UPI002FD4E80C